MNHIITILNELTKGMPVGTNLAMMHFLWMLVSGAMLPNRGAIIPGLKSIGLSDEASQYSGVQGAVMGVYNLPFFLVSLVTAVMGNNALRKGNDNLAKKLFFASILSSTVGTLLMLAWGLGILA